MNCLKKLFWRPTHRHYKGGYYKVLYNATKEDTLSELIVYEDKNGKVWVRTANNFYENIPDPTNPANYIPRFKKIE